MTRSLWDPATVGALHLPHRLAMAPMTRDRSTPQGVPTALNAEYYAQRASFALVITEGTQPSADGQGYLLTPGLHTEEQVEGWRGVADAVHAAGGRLVVQLMHVGRIGHPDNTPHHRPLVAPSAVAPDVTMITATGPQPVPVPRALTTDEVADVVQDFRRAAAAAVRAGADAVEIHGANGYLVHQFLSANANLRDDRWGGSVENRIRFAVEVARAVAEEIGPDRTGIRIAPGGTYNDIAEPDAVPLYDALLAGLAPLGLAYLHVVATGDEDHLRRLRDRWAGRLLLNRGGADLERRVADVEGGLADVITVGTMALANPDLVDRVRLGAPLNTPDRATFYGGDARGYTDYPVLDPRTLDAVGSRP